MGSILGSKQGFQAASRFAADIGALNPVNAHTQTHPLSFIHIHTHLLPKSEHFLRYREDMPSALASHWPSDPTCIFAFGDSFHRFTNTF